MKRHLVFIAAPLVAAVAAAVALAEGGRKVVLRTGDNVVVAGTKLGCSDERVYLVCSKAGEPLRVILSPDGIAFVRQASGSLSEQTQPGAVLYQSSWSGKSKH